jgi:hypothetical protein
MVAQLHVHRSLRPYTARTHTGSESCLGQDLVMLEAWSLDYFIEASTQAFADRKQT